VVQVWWSVDRKSDDCDWYTGAAAAVGKDRLSVGVQRGSAAMTLGAEGLGVVTSEAICVYV